MKEDPSNADNPSQANPFVYGVPLRFEDDDADTTIRPSRYKDWMGPMRLQPVKEAPESADADDQECSRHPGVHLRLDDGEEWSLIDQDPPNAEAPPPSSTEKDQGAKDF